MAGRYGPNVLIALVLILADIAAWVVLLGGASGLQHYSTTIAPLLNQMSGVLTYGDLTPQTIPRRFISYEWFKAVLQILTLLFALGALAAGQFHRFRLAIVGLLAVNAVLFCDASQTFYYLRIQVDAAEAVTGQTIARLVRVWWAGCMMTAGLNLALIIVLGSGMSEARPYDLPSTAPATGKRFGNGAAADDTIPASGGRSQTVV